MLFDHAFRCSFHTHTAHIFTHRGLRGKVCVCTEHAFVRNREMLFCIIFGNRFNNSSRTQIWYRLDSITKNVTLKRILTICGRNHDKKIYLHSACSSCSLRCFSLSQNVRLRIQPEKEDVTIVMVTQISFVLGVGLGKMHVSPAFFLELVKFYAGINFRWRKLSDYLRVNVCKDRTFSGPSQNFEFAHTLPIGRL